MTTKSPIIKRLKASAAKASARAAAAKDEVRAAKTRLKQARKAFKAERKAAKQARRKVDAAAARTARKPRPAATLKLKPAVRKRTPAKVAAKTKSAPQPKKAVPLKGSKARAAKPTTETMRSAAEVAKSVIERLHAPPPALPPEPHIPPTDGSGNFEAAASLKS
jgi:hypothetical protein